MSQPSRDELWAEFREEVLEEFLEAGGLIEAFEEYYEDYLDTDIRTEEG